jgi:transcriptional regulator with XRE-family HTH domain
MVVSTVADFRKQLAWSQRELARRARLDPMTVRKAESGEPINGQSANAIADALSEAFGQRILPRDIEGLNVRV